MRIHPLVILIGALGLLPGEVAAQAAGSAAPKVRVSGYLQVRETYAEGLGLSTSLNRARVGVAGTIVPELSWKALAELRTGSVGTGKASVSLQDAFVRWERGVAAVQAGQFKTPFTREYLTSITDLETPNRAIAVDALAPKRDLGVMGEIGVGLPVTLSAGVFNGEGVNVTANRDSALLAVGRLAARPLPGVELGAGIAAYGGDSLRYGADVALRAGPATLRAEYLGQRRDGVAGDDAGWYVLGGVQAHPALQLVARYEELEQTAIADAADARAWTAGAVLGLVDRRAKLLLAVTGRRDAPGAEWDPAAVAQLQLRF
jgi:hypothetical protein